MPSYKASYSFIHNKIMIHTTYNKWIPKSIGVVTNLIIFSTGKPLNSPMTAQLSTQNPQTGTKKQQHYLTLGAEIPPAEMFMKLVHEFHPSHSSHRGNMPCLSKLTTSSLKQSQQTCMGTYLSQAEDSSYSQTMTSLFLGYTLILGLRKTSR